MTLAAMLVPNVPFVANPSRNDCHAACILSALRFFKPDAAPLLDAILTVTRSDDFMILNKPRSAVFLAEQGLRVHWYDTISLAKMTADPHSYLADVLCDITDLTDVHSIDELAPHYEAVALHPAITYIHRSPTRDDLRLHLESGALAVLNVDQSQLVAEMQPFGHTYHYILALGCDEHGITAHNAGVPPRPYQEISWGRLACAWGLPRTSPAWLMTISRY